MKEKCNWEDWEEPQGDKLKEMFALVMREQVQTIITNHVYTFGGKLYN